MARLIPPICQNDAPPGEKRIFELIANAPGTEDWIVLHSLMLARHRRLPMGEIDFVVLIPQLGMIFLEVKSHRAIEFLDGVWLYGASKKSGKNPFAQAREGMFSVREKLVREIENLSRIPFAYGVSFPSVTFHNQSIEWERWQIVDQKDLLKPGLKVSLEKLIRETTAVLLINNKSVFVEPAIFTETFAKKILSTLRPSFDLVPIGDSQQQEVQIELLKLTSQQYLILDAFESNSRILISGPAGTGKTVLTNESLRRAVGSGDSKIAYFCFNKNLAQKLREQIRTPNGVTIANIDAWLTEISDYLAPQDSVGRTHFQEELPAKAVDAILSRDDLAGSFDLVIIDEAQDILKPHYLEIIDLILKGGLRGGKWIMGGDFVYQNVYSEFGLSPEEFLENYGTSAARLTLTKNCRNSPEIGTFVSQHSIASPLYEGYLRANYEQDPSTHFFEEHDEQLSLVLGTIKALVSEGVSVSDIVVLSPMRTGSVGELLENHPGNPFKLRRFGQTRRPSIRYTTIHGFKGLESHAVIVTDICSLSEEYEKTLLYVALSRAQNRLELFCHKAVKPELRKLLLRN